MNEILISLDSDLREKLAAALASGKLSLTGSRTALLAQVGRIEQLTELLTALHELDTLGMSGPAAAAALRALNRLALQQRSPDLVLSGKEQLGGIFARDTRAVYEELFSSARQSLWISSYVVVDGKEVFERLAEQMQQRPQLAVTLIVNVERSYRDTSSDQAIVGRFFQNFWTNVWPGERRPRVFYDRRALAEDDKAVLHAKCVVADERRLFITSANLTPRAQTDNIELGLLVDERTKALSVIRFFERLIADGRLLPLPG